METRAHFDVISFVVITAFSEKTVGDNVVNVEFVQDWVGVLSGGCEEEMEEERKKIPC
jgi:hypothetical protein